MPDRWLVPGQGGRAHQRDGSHGRALCGIRLGPDAQPDPPDTVPECRTCQVRAARRATTPTAYWDRRQ